MLLDHKNCLQWANMSVHDVAAVDHLNSLQRPRKFDEKKHFLNFDTKQSNSRRSPYNASLPTSPTSERKTDSDTLRRAMARHQASLSRPESPIRNDNLPAPGSRYPTYSRQPPPGSPAPERGASRRREGYRTMGATKTTNSVGTKVNSSEVWRGEESPEYGGSYPYLSHPTFSLPRNHRLYKSSSSQQFSATLKESEESLSGNYGPREFLLGRYPSSSLHSTPVKSDFVSPSCGDNSKHISRSSSTRSSRNNSPRRRIKHNSYELQKFQRGVPEYQDYSLCSSRAASPESLVEPGLFCDRGRPTSPSYSIPSLDSRRSSRAASPTYSLKSNKSNAKGSSRREYITISRSSSLRSSRATSPNTLDVQKTNLQSESGNLFSLEELKKNPHAEVIYVRETFKVVPSQINGCSVERKDKEKIHVEHGNEFPDAHLVKLSTEESHIVIKNSPRDHNTEEKSINQTDEAKVSQKEGIAQDDSEASCQDDLEDKTSVAEEQLCCSDQMGKARSMDLSLEGIENLEELLESLSRKARNDPDNADSARTESVSSFVSTTSSKARRYVQERENEGDDSYSLIRRQSVIIDGLTMETEELRNKCQLMEEELSTPAVLDLSQKLEQVEGKLEETENYCYQVVEENVELKSEIETLESEISEVQDTFRDKDAKEFKKVKWELENLSKTCRNLQIKLGKAQAKASRLRQEKEMIEEEQREKNLWRTSAVVAVAAVAAYQLISRLK